MKTVRNLLCGLAALLAISLQAKENVFTSPDSRYILTLDDGGGQVTYSLQWDGKTVILPSVLGLEAGRPLRDGLRIGEIRDLGETDTTWKPVYGERAVVPDHFKAWEVSLLSPEGRPVLGLEIRAYNEGIAFRYLVTAGSYIHITDEFTEYTFPERTLAYFTPRAQTPYTLLPLKDWPGDGESDRPLLLRLPEGGFACLAEAQVVDYVRTKFRLADKPNTVTAAMYGPVDEIAPYNLSLIHI